jgi:hypothetical protein
MTTCIQCNKCIEGKPWMSFKNDQNNNLHICSYICSNRYGSVGLKNIVNIQDFTKYPIPFINFDEILNETPEDFYSLNQLNMDNLSEIEYLEYLEDIRELQLEESDTDSECSFNSLS